MTQQHQQPGVKKFDINEAMSETCSIKKDKNTNASIRHIANCIYAWYNLLNILIASQSKGKSYHSNE